MFVVCAVVVCACACLSVSVFVFALGNMRPTSAPATSVLHTYIRSAANDRTFHYQAKNSACQITNNILQVDPRRAIAIRILHRRYQPHHCSILRAVARSVTSLPLFERSVDFTRHDDIL